MSTLIIVFEYSQHLVEFALQLISLSGAGKFKSFPLCFISFNLSASLGCCLVLYDVAEHGVV